MLQRRISKDVKFRQRRSLKIMVEKLTNINDINSSVDDYTGTQDKMR